MNTMAASIMASIDWNMFLVCFAFILVDIASGILKGCANNSFSSSVMREGLMHKASTLLILLCAGLCDICKSTAGVELPWGVGIVDAFGVLVIVMELSSVLENCVAVNPELAELPIFKVFGLGDKKEQ